MKRFEEKFIPEPNSGCWLWVAAITASGYGNFKIDGGFKGAHRVSYELYKGTIPDGLQVLHRCDNRCCVNPDHLFVGTQSDNMYDKVAKGRDNHADFSGEKNPRAKVTKEQVDEIRALFKHGIRKIDLSRRYGVTATAINSIITGKNWANEGIRP